jgi:chromatin remodeling complex protein RSC6
VVKTEKLDKILGLQKTINLNQLIKNLNPDEVKYNGLRKAMQ